MSARLIRVTADCLIFLVRMGVDLGAVFVAIGQTSVTGFGRLRA